MLDREVDLLCTAGRFNGLPIEGELIETHISWVILAGEDAFKIKKPMEYSFLDFSSIDQRKYYCQREVELNSRFTDIYLGVLPIRLEGDVFAIGNGPGDPVEFCVHMKRLNNSLRMDVCVDDGRVTDEDLVRLVDVILPFHKRAEVISRPFNPPRTLADFNDILGIQDFVSTNLGESHAGLITRAVELNNAFIVDYHSAFERRISDGFIRNLHGDLHARNIFLYNPPVLFDCIEFNDRMRHIDVMNELAFFCMDLQARRRNDLVRTFLGAYLERDNCIRNEDEWAMFAYYKAYRANVKAKVNALRAMQADADAEATLSMCAHYLGVMQDCLDEMSPGSSGAL